MSMGQEDEGLQPVSPERGVTGGDRQTPSQRGNRPEKGSQITVSGNQCPHCGAVVPSRYHEGCDASIIRVGGDWKCGSCGIKMRPNTTCVECDRSLQITTAEVGVDRRTSTAPEEIEKAIHQETNRKRRDHGLSEVSYTHHLSAIALRHSRDMAQREYFSHESPEGNGPNDRYRKFGHDTRRSGENLAKEYAHVTQSADEVARDVVDGWMNSPPHRKNILRGAFQTEGIGVYLETNGAVYATQNFF